MGRGMFTIFRDQGNYRCCWALLTRELVLVFHHLWCECQGTYCLSLSLHWRWGRDQCRTSLSQQLCILFCWHSWEITVCAPAHEQFHLFFDISALSLMRHIMVVSSANLMWFDLSLAMQIWVICMNSSGLSTVIHAGGDTSAQGDGGGGLVADLDWLRSQWVQNPVIELQLKMRNPPDLLGLLVLNWSLWTALWHVFFLLRWVIVRWRVGEIVSSAEQLGWHMNFRSSRVVGRLVLMSLMTSQSKHFMMICVSAKIWQCWFFSTVMITAALKHCGKLLGSGSYLSGYQPAAQSLSAYPGTSRIHGQREGLISSLAVFSASNCA